MPNLASEFIHSSPACCLSASAKPDLSKKDFARFVTKLLLMLGFSPRHYGFSYMREMILICFAGEDKTLSGAYSKVADEFNQPIDAVMTAVRTALKNAQNSKSFCRLESLLGAMFIEPKYLLAPREFLGIVLEYLKYVWDGESDIPFKA